MFRIAESRGGCTPDAGQALFLKACLAPPHMAIALWQEWKTTHTLEVIDESLFRQLALLYHSLQAAGFEGPEMPVLKGLARRTWVLNQKVFRRATELIDAFGAQRIPVLLLKGMALSAAYYPTPYLRSMSDSDVMVPHARVDEAIAILLRRRWRPLFPMPDGYIRKWHGCTFVNEEREELDLHWDLFAGYTRNRECWTRSLPFYYQERPVRLLCPTDNLLHVCLHGYRWNPLHPLRWVADACIILQRRSAEIDWATAVHEAACQQMSLRLSKSLSYLKKEFAAPVPDAVLAALAAIPISAQEARATALLTREEAESIAA